MTSLYNWRLPQSVVKSRKGINCGKPSPCKWGEASSNLCDLVTQWGSPHHCTRPTLLTMLNIYKSFFSNLTSFFGWDMSMNMGTWACSTLPNSASFLINHCPKLLSVPLHDLKSSSLNSYWMMHVLIVISIWNPNIAVLLYLYEQPVDKPLLSTVVWMSGGMFLTFFNTCVLWRLSYIYLPPWGGLCWSEKVFKDYKKDFKGLHCYDALFQLHTLKFAAIFNYHMPIFGLRSLVGVYLRSWILLTCLHIFQRSSW
jgi:hypothetical protein